MVFQVLLFLLCLHSNDIIPFGISFYTKVTLMLIFNHTASSNKKKRKKKETFATYPNKLVWIHSTFHQLDKPDCPLPPGDGLVCKCTLQWTGTQYRLLCYDIRRKDLLDHHSPPLGLHKKHIKMSAVYYNDILTFFFFYKKQQIRSVCVRCNLAYDMDKFLFKITLLNIL